MGKKTLAGFVAAALILGFGGSAFAVSGYLTQFNTRYGTAATPLNTCNVCHSPSIVFNPYGDAFLASGNNFASIESADSDGDGFGNLAEIQARTFPGNPASVPAAADTTRPSVTAFSLPATSTALTVPITALTASDNVGVTGYMVTEAPAAPAATAAGWSLTPPTSFAFTAAGAKTLFAWAKDAAGNVSASLSAAVTITLSDAVPPTVTGFSVPPTSATLQVPITVFTASDNVGVTGFMVTESPAAPAAAAAGWSPAPPTSFAFASFGVKTLFAWAKDAAANVSAGLSAPVTLAPPPPPPKSPAVMGLYTNGAWFLDNNGNWVWEGCGADACLPAFGGLPGDVPVTGDWNGNGTKGIAIYRQGSWYLDKNGNGAWDGCEVDGCLGPFGGSAADVPVVGDWTGDGIAKIGIYRQGSWYLDKNGNGAWDGCEVDGCLGPFGGYAADIPVAGDWTGDGIAKIGVYRQGEWYLDNNGNGAWDGCGADTCVDLFGGLPIDRPIVGDWTGDGIAKIGIYQNGLWFLDKNNTGTWDDCAVDICISGFGSAADMPVAK